MTGGAGGQILSRTVAARALDIKLHATAGLRNLSSAVAFRTFSWRLERSLAVTMGTDIMARDVEPHHTAADGCPERNVDLIFEVSSRLRTFFGMCGAMASTEDGAKDVSETATAACATASASASAGIVDQVRKIEAPEIEVNALAAIGRSA